jgi:hypothetical protein
MDSFQKILDELNRIRNKPYQCDCYQREEILESIEQGLVDTLTLLRDKFEQAPPSK